MKHSLIPWLLDSDVSLQFQVHRDLLKNHRRDLQERIPGEGWGKALLDQRRDDGHWGLGYYQPTWTGTHYSLQELRNLSPPRDTPMIRESVELTLSTQKGEDGGINPARSLAASDLCVTAMVLDFASSFDAPEDDLRTLVDFLLGGVLDDGGFNCRFNRSGAVHSSMHSTVCALEGLRSYRQAGYGYRLADMEAVVDSSVEFLLRHHLYLSDRTGEVIHKDFLRLSYPGRWRYDILRALDVLRDLDRAPDTRMNPALDTLVSMADTQGRWKLRAKYPGLVHFDMEQAGKPSRWNTLRALRVLQHFRPE